MFSRFSFWIWGTIILQWFTAILHSIGQFLSPAPENIEEKEKTLLDLMANFKKDFGAGYVRSTDDFLFALGISFTLFCLLGGFVNWWLYKKRISGDIWRGLLAIEMIIFGINFITMQFYTFLPPVVCTGLVFLFTIGAFATSRNAKTA